MPRRLIEEKDELDSDSDDSGLSSGEVIPNLITVEGELEEPTTPSYAAKYLYDEICGNRIDLDPEYQRDVVWSEEAQRQIIVSYMERYHVPPILFRVKRQGDEEIRVCIDGKQRLTSIRYFFDGKIPYVHQATGKMYFYKINPLARTKKTKRLLPEKWRQRMERKQIHCEEYHQISDIQERALFQRVQACRGVALSPAEKLKALPGPMPSYARQALHMHMSEQGLEEEINLNTARDNNFGALVRLLFTLYSIENGNSEPMNPTDIKLSKWMVVMGAPTEAFKERVARVFSTWHQLVQNENHKETAFGTPADPHDPTLNAQHPIRFSPVEFVLTGVIIAKHPGLSIGRLAWAIHNFREKLHREFYGEKKVNAKVFRFFWDWEARELQGAGVEEKGKRQRAEGDESGDEYLPGPSGLREGTSTRRTRARLSKPADNV